MDSRRKTRYDTCDEVRDERRDGHSHALRDHEGEPEEGDVDEEMLGSVVEVAHGVADGAEHQRDQEHKGERDERVGDHVRPHLLCFVGVQHAGVRVCVVSLA